MSRHKAVHCDVMTYKISNSLEAVIIRHYVAPWLVEGPYKYIGAMADTDSALATHIFTESYPSAIHPK